MSFAWKHRGGGGWGNPDSRKKDALRKNSLYSKLVKFINWFDCIPLSHLGFVRTPGSFYLFISAQPWSPW